MHFFLGSNKPIMFRFLKIFLVFLLLSIWVYPQHCKARVFNFKMHHRFSDSFKNMFNSTISKTNWPHKGSFEYYGELARRDQMLRGRKLSNADAPLSLSDGNTTFRISSLGFLHYTTVELGTPGVKFMVALDTGSDLFWVPCDCSKCAPTEGVSYASDFELNIYNPKQSLTSKKVACNNNLCVHRNHCLGTFSSCPYKVSYVSAQTSTSGILVEDVLHLATENSDQESIKAYVTFGCGQVQSGSFLNTAAPNGLFGLGMDPISVPSILSREGLIADSFSMCFGHDGVGRISFGDRGSPDQAETPLNTNPSHPAYNISVTQVRVGTALIDVNFTTLFDSGTSFTYLIDPTYTKVSEKFHAQAQNKRRPPDPRIPFEYCYEMSAGENSSFIPSMRLTMKGGHHFVVSDPIIVITTENELAYCLAVVKSTELNIIGQNFMTGYRVVFDREKVVLGWKETNCYDQVYNSIPTEPPASNVPPAVAAGLGNYSNPLSTKKDSNKSQSSAASSYDCNHNCSVIILIFIFMLCNLSSRIL